MDIVMRRCGFDFEANPPNKKTFGKRPPRQLPWPMWRSYHLWIRPWSSQKAFQRSLILSQDCSSRYHGFIGLIQDSIFSKAYIRDRCPDAHAMTIISSANIHGYTTSKKIIFFFINMGIKVIHRQNVWWWWWCISNWNFVGASSVRFN